MRLDNAMYNANLETLGPTALQNVTAWPLHVIDLTAHV